MFQGEKLMFPVQKHVCTVRELVFSVQKHKMLVIKINL